MNKAILFIYTLAGLTNANAMHFSPQLDHTKCGVHTIPIVYEGTTHYKTIRATLSTPIGTLACCKHVNKANIPKGLTSISELFILCDESNQYLHIYNKYSGSWQTVLINDHPIVTVPHSAPAPQE